VDIQVQLLPGVQAEDHEPAPHYIQCTSYGPEDSPFPPNPQPEKYRLGRMPGPMTTRMAGRSHREEERACFSGEEGERFEVEHGHTSGSTESERGEGPRGKIPTASRGHRYGASPRTGRRRRSRVSNRY
jgi:hypothetical protein